MAKQFTEKDVDTSGNLPRIYTGEFRLDLIYAPTEWQKRGLQETRGGYGNRLNSGYKIYFCGKPYRVYVTQFSNAGSVWFKAKGRKIFVS
jgi:hypothetical protein